MSENTIQNFKIWHWGILKKKHVFVFFLAKKHFELIRPELSQIFYFYLFVRGSFSSSSTLIFSSLSTLAFSSSSTLVFSSHLDCTICLNCCQRLVLKSEQFILHLRALSSQSTPCQALKKKEQNRNYIGSKVKVMSSLQPGSPPSLSLSTRPKTGTWTILKCPPIHGSKLIVK